MPPDNKIKKDDPFMSRLRRYFVSGLIIFLPLALTINLLVLTFNIADGFLGKYLQPYFSREFGFYVRGISILVCLSVILLIGFFATNFLGRTIYPVFESALLKLPFFKQVYPAFKEIALFLFSREKFTFRQVVLIEYPRKGLFSVGFLTNEASSTVADKTGRDLCYVFVPHTPSPLTGFLTLVPKEELVFPDISVEEAIKIIVTGGVIKSHKDK
jgi:uncharacterized membrane protein